MKSVMELLYELRVDHDLTQAEVGAVLGISQQHYSKYETGEYELICTQNSGHIKN